MTAFPSPTLLLKKIGYVVIIWYFKIMRISVRNFFCSKVLCTRGGLTLKTQQVLNHELMSAMKEYLTQGRKNFWRTIEKTMRWNGKYEERSRGRKTVWYCSCPLVMGWRRRRWMTSLTCYFIDTPLWLLLKTFPTPPPNFLFSFFATKFSQCFFRQDRGGGGVCAV